MDVHQTQTATAAPVPAGGAARASAHGPGCAVCEQPLGFDFSMAFQPIVDVSDGTVFAYEALVRGTAGEGARTVLDRVTAANRYAFDQACRTKAIELADRLGLERSLSINFLPNAVYQPETCLSATLAAADRVGFPLERIIFEVTESEEADSHKVAEIIGAYRQKGFRTAIDDFGAGHSGLNRVVELRPDLIKLDIGLIRGIDADAYRRAMVASVAAFCREAGVTLVAEGIETPEEHRALRDLGIVLQQGYLFARPAFEALPAPALRH